MNLEGLQTRYERPVDVLAEIAEAPPDEVTALMQRLYQAPMREDLIGRRIGEIKAAGVPAAASATPVNAERLGRLAAEARVDVFVVQSTVTTARFRSTSGPQLSFARFCHEIPVPVVVGNCVSYEAAAELMETGIAIISPSVKRRVVNANNGNVRNSAFEANPTPINRKPSAMTRRTG